MKKFLYELQSDSTGESVGTVRSNLEAGTRVEALIGEKYIVCLLQTPTPIVPAEPPMEPLRKSITNKLLRRVIKKQPRATVKTHTCVIIDKGHPRYSEIITAISEAGLKRKLAKVFRQTGDLEVAIFSGRSATHDALTCLYCTDGDRIGQLCDFDLQNYSVSLARFLS